MKVKIHKLFEYLLEVAEPAPEAFVGFSLSPAPKLGAFLADLDPEMSLDWNQRSFQGLPELRSAVLRQAGLERTCGPEDVLITAGAAEANYLTIMQTLEAGDEIVIERPGWPQAAVLAQAIGARIRWVTRREDEGWRLDPARVADAVTPATRMIFLSNPNNPTGQVLGADDLEQIAMVADRVGAWLIVDEVYAGLEWDGQRAPSIAGIYPRGITTGSVSKALGLQGLRTGWMISRDPGMIRDAVILRENSSEIMNVLGEAIAEIALRPARYDVAMGTARALGLANLERLDRFVRETPGLSWQRPRAGLIGLARLDGVDGEVFARRLLGPPYRTFVLPGSAYDQPGHIRLGVGGSPGDNLELGLERLARCLGEFLR